MKLRHYLTAALAVLSVSCQTSGQSDYLSSQAPEEGKLFGEYLAGSYANYLDKSKVRSDYYSRAFKRASDDVDLGRRAMSSAITAGQLDLAQSLARQVQSLDKDEPMARALLGIRAFKDKRYGQAETYFAADTNDITMGLLMDITQGWSHIAEGDFEAGMEQLGTLDGGSYFFNHGILQIAKAEAYLGNEEAARKIFEEAEEIGQSPIETRLAKARFLHGLGENELALAELKAFSKENGDFETGPVKAYIDTLEAGENFETRLSPQQEAARALTDPAFGFFVANRARDAGEVFLRLALSLDPNHHKAALWLGSLLESSEREDEALALYNNIPARSEYYVSTQLSVANVWFSRDEDDKAIAVLEAINAQQPSYVTREALGRARLIRENYEEALPIYDAIVKSLSDEEIEANTQPLYFRAISYERTKQWPLAEADFKRVLEIEPENADALNYLGYTWVDRGENLTEAFDMIRRAIQIEPNSGAIVDSLGWAHYKLGQYSEAKAKLEDAVALSPSSATIVDHLGDVYWKLGRYREAGYQWERALEFDPTEEERDQIQQKLKGGLEAVTARP